MELTKDTLKRYAPGGDIYTNLETQYGKAGADRVYQASIKDPDSISGVLGELRSGPPLEDSTVKIFGGQIATDPFGAPLAAANKGLQTITTSAVLGLFKNPFVLLAVAAFLFFQFGGGKWLAGRLKLA